VTKIKSIKIENEKQGFTLIEMLVAIAILSVLALTVYGAFSNGLRLWQRINQEESHEDINIFLLKLSYELRRCFKFSNIKFLGEEDNISFATLIKADREETIGQVNYFFDGSANTINRVQSNYSQLYQSKPTPEQQVLKNIKSFNLQYYCCEPKQKKYLWLKAWDKKKVPSSIKADEYLPLAVKIEIELDDNNKNKKFVRIVNIPVGGEAN
jgi:prepilin-type N-terminal cleavage/methylation domain-containing protein